MEIIPIVLSDHNEIKFCCCSVAQLCPALCNPMDCSTPGFPVLHHLSEFRANLRSVSWWCHPTISSSVTPPPPVFTFSQHQGLFQWVGSSHQVARVLELLHWSPSFKYLLIQLVKIFALIFFSHCWSWHPSPCLLASCIFSSRFCFWLSPLCSFLMVLFFHWVLCLVLCWGHSLNFHIFQYINL